MLNRLFIQKYSNSFSLISNVEVSFFTSFYYKLFI